LSLSINGEDPVTGIAAKDVFDNELIDTLDVIVSVVGTTPIKLRFGYYTGRGG